MARTWLQIRVDLVGGRGVDLDPTPGRIFICGPSHSFGRLADAINRSFATFDFGDDWRHRCQVLPEKLDPREIWGPGPLPRDPVPVWGWGGIPDQYGRRSFDGPES